MEINDIIDYLLNDNYQMNLYFSRKLRDSKYLSFAPNINKNIYDELLVLVVDYLSKFREHEIIKYDPTGYTDGTIEKYNVSCIQNYENVITSFKTADTVESAIDPDGFNFYTFELLSKRNSEINNVQIFRRVTKFKKLHSKGIIAFFNGKQLNKIESKIIGIDGEVDFVIVNDEIYIISHYSLERIFNLQEQFKDTASQFLKQEGLNEGIENFEVFYEDCINDGRIRKTVTKMSTENIDINKTYDNYQNIIKTIDMFGLEIEYYETPRFKLIYDSKDQITDILRILRDAYYRSLINEQHGVAG